MRAHPLRPGLTGLLLLAGCGVAPAPPAAPPIAPPPAVAPPQPGPEAPSLPEAAAPAVPAPMPTEPAPAEPVAPVAPPVPAPLVVLPTPAPIAPPVSSGGGGGGFVPPPPAATPVPAQVDAQPLKLRRLPIAAITVDSEMAGAPRANLADRKPETRWSSRSASGGWAQLAFARREGIAAIAVSLPAGLGYDVRISDDGTTWTTVLPGLVNATWGPESRPFPPGTQARYVRVAHAGTATPGKPFALMEVAVHTEAPATAELPPLPWDRPVSPKTEAHIATAGLGYMTGGHTDTPLHIHAYVQVWVNGVKVTVPANLGIAHGKTAWMHTHDTTGTIHMEGPADQTFTLGQFFTLWDIPLAGAKVYDHGRRVWNPERLRLKDKLLLKVVFGKPPVGEPGIPLE